MSFTRVLDWLRGSSLRRVAVLQIVVLGGTLLAFLALAHWSIRRDLASTSRAIMLDDMLDFVRLYKKEGAASLLRVASAARRSEHQFFRLVQPSATGTSVLYRTPADELTPYAWDRLPPLEAKIGEFDWRVIDHPSGDGELRVFRYRLNDGNTLWYGRTNGDELLYLAGAMRRLGFIAFYALLTITVPVAWFARRVFTPLKKLTSSAHVLAESTEGEHLVATGAIPEIVSFADAFNTCQNRIAILTLASQKRIATLAKELNTVNDQLAHELKTPLARVRGNIESLLNHYGEPEGLDAAVRSLDEIDRTNDLIRNILTLRLADNGAIRLHLELTPAFEFLSDIVETYTPAAEALDLDFAFESESDGLVLLDRHRMRQAVTNLLDNAFAYTPRGGDVTVLQSVDDTGFTIRVRDTGHGLSDDDIRRIWQRFARGSAAKTDDPGTGLGLPLVRAVAQAHFGDAGCLNRPEGGAEFWLWLPLAPQISERKPSGGETSESSSGGDEETVSQE